MRHLYRISGRHGCDLVAADDAREALGCWAQSRDQGCDPEADTAQVEQVPDGERLKAWDCLAWDLAWTFDSPELLRDADDVLLHLGGSRG